MKKPSSVSNRALCVSVWDTEPLSTPDTFHKVVLSNSKSLPRTEFLNEFIFPLLILPTHLPKTTVQSPSTRKITQHRVYGAGS